jgi:hypothetical protein
MHVARPASLRHVVAKLGTGFVKRTRSTTVAGITAPAPRRSIRAFAARTAARDPDHAWPLTPITDSIASDA